MKDRLRRRGMKPWASRMARVAMALWGLMQMIGKDKVSHGTPHKFRPSARSSAIRPNCCRTTGSHRGMELHVSVVPGRRAPAPRSPPSLWRMRGHWMRKNGSEGSRRQWRRSTVRRAPILRRDHASAPFLQESGCAWQAALPLSWRFQHRSENGSRQGADRYCPASPLGEMAGGQDQRIAVLATGR